MKRSVEALGMGLAFVTIPDESDTTHPKTAQEDQAYTPDTIEHMIRQHPMLTKREKQICYLILQGIQNKEIAFLLKISERTVGTHRANIYRKFDVKNAVELFHYHFFE